MPYRLEGDPRYLSKKELQAALQQNSGARFWVSGIELDSYLKKIRLTKQKQARQARKEAAAKREEQWRSQLPRSQELVNFYQHGMAYPKSS
jgi:hypothetical protein